MTRPTRLARALVKRVLDLARGRAGDGHAQRAPTASQTEAIVGARPRRAPGSFRQWLGRPYTPAIQQRTVRAGGHRVRYATRVPDGPALPAGWPLVVCLHPRWADRGGRRGHGRRALRTFFTPALRDVRALLVAPDCPAASWTDAASERAVLEVIDHLRARFRIDAGRIALAGLSDGATGVWRLLARQPARFGAGLAVSGSPRIEWARGPGTAPVYAIHSRADTVMPLAPTRAAVAALRLRGVAAELVILEDAAHDDLERFIEPLRAAGAWLDARGDWREAARTPPAFSRRELGGLF